MRRVTLISVLIAPMLITHALLAGTPVVDDGPLVANDGPCAPATLASTNASSRTHGVERDRPAAWTISYGLLESIVERGGSRFAAFLDRTFVEPGELRVFFAFLEPDDLGELEVIDYFNQRSAERLNVDEYGVVSVPWAEIQEHGLPELPDDATPLVTLTCSQQADQT